MRHVFYFISAISLLLIAAIYPIWPPVLYFLIIVVPYILVGIHDVLSVKHTVLRNYPVIGHMRYILEAIRPEMHQYFIESDNNGAPFSREIRSLIYQRAKGVRETVAFGTKHDITSVGYQFSYHSLTPKEVPLSEGRLIIGGPDCKQPYDSSRLNISGMSFGALSPNAIRALNKGAARGNFAHNTGEGGISHYHLSGQGDLIWQIGTGYFGCRSKDGSFNAEAFELGAKKDVVKMIEIKLSQGAKPAHGGILPGIKVTDEIARIRMLEAGVDAISPSAHPEFSDPVGLLKFVEKLRKLSGGKPVGIKLCIGHRVEFMAICKAMIKTGIKPDFITVDGAEGGTGAALVAFANYLGTPLNEAITFVNNCLVGANLRKDIKIIASGKIAIGYDLVTKIALGADGCSAARAMMFALGCIQSLKCNTDECPTGIATQNKARWASLYVPDKATRVANFHKRTTASFLELVGALGLASPDDLTPAHILRYTDVGVSKSYATLYPQLEPGELLTKDSSGVYADLWKLAKPTEF